MRRAPPALVDSILRLSLRAVKSYLGVNSRPQNVPDNVVTLEAYRIERCIVAPSGHPILGVLRPTADLARYPVIDCERAMIFVRRNARPPSFVYELIELISPQWKRLEVDKLLHDTQALHRKPRSAQQASNGRR
jgi:hypothetical protein